MPVHWPNALFDVLLSPALWFSVALAVTYSTVHYLWRGGGLRELSLDLFSGLLGFGAGQLVGEILGLDQLHVGEVQLLSGSLGAFLALLLSRYLRRKPA